jgi:para-nitrobenzyl esterase
MKKALILALLTLQVAAFAQLESNPPAAKTVNGTVEGISKSGISIFLGIPYAAPPVGDLRWKAPQPVKNWQGVKKTVQFGPRAMQAPVFSDMVFRSEQVGEDCLYLNVWTPVRKGTEKLPVLVYFYGGGFIAGDGSEFRYDGEHMARSGIVAVTVNYRLGVFGFMAHPELTKESPNHASGNYAFLDQNAALKWVQQNIAAFGGDPKKVTIAGESAGSASVSAQMASPLSKNLIAGAIGESGALIKPTLGPVSQQEAEQIGVKFATTVGAASLADLRAMSAEKLLQVASKWGVTGFPAVIDGYFFPKSPADIYMSGQQAHVPLLLGWNSEEMNYRMIMGNKEPTPENYKAAVKALYPDNAEEALKYYPGNTPEEAQKSATALAGDRFIAFSTWKWYDAHLKTGGSPVYRYFYERPRPAMRSDKNSTAATGAVHSAEIEYAMGNLPFNRVYDWQPEDYLVSYMLQGYFINFIKTGDPNGMGLPQWPKAVAGKPAQVMHINVDTRAENDPYQERYEWMNKQYTNSK